MSVTLLSVRTVNATSAPRTIIRRSKIPEPVVLRKGEIYC